MKQIGLGTIKRCECCKQKKTVNDMYGWATSQVYMRKTGKVIERKMRGTPAIKSFICMDCWPNSWQQAAYSRFKGLEGRQRNGFNVPLTFTADEFLLWIKKTPFRKLLKADRASRTSSSMSPSVDRINSWLDYRFDNMQIIGCGENATKSNQPALGAQIRTMRFFKLLRKQTGKTKYQMAKHLGMLPQTYFYLEEKARGCSFEILCLIKKKLDLDWNILGAMIEDEVIITKKDKAKEQKEATSLDS